MNLPFNFNNNLESTRMEGILKWIIVISLVVGGLLAVSLCGFICYIIYFLISHFDQIGQWISNI